MIRDLCDEEACNCELNLFLPKECWYTAYVYSFRTKRGLEQRMRFPESRCDVGFYACLFKGHCTTQWNVQSLLIVVEEFDTFFGLVCSWNTFSMRRRAIAST